MSEQINIYALNYGGIVTAFDNAARIIMGGFGARFIGAGVFLADEGQERDQQWQIDADKADAAEAALQKIGLRTKRTAVSE